MSEKKKKTPQTIRASAETMGAFKKYAKGFKNQDEALMDLLKKADCGDSDAPMSELPGTEISVEEDWNAELEKSFLVFSEMVCHTKQSVRELLLKTLQIKDHQMMETQRECDRLKAQNKNLQAKIKTKAPSESEHIEKVPQNTQAAPLNAESADSQKKEEFNSWAMQAEIVLELKKENDSLKKEKEFFQFEYEKEISLARREAALEAREELVSRFLYKTPERDDKTLSLKSDLASAAVFE
jgi:Sec-independent protein translocase protein TatA